MQDIYVYISLGGCIKPLATVLAATVAYGKLLLLIAVVQFIV
jgi:hypothetical protein